MPAKIDQSLLPPVIKDSVDPEILNRAQSIEWSIARDFGDDEHGYLDGSHEDYLSSQNLMYKTHQARLGAGKQVEWLDQKGGRDSGFEHSPTSPALGAARSADGQPMVDLSPLNEFESVGGVANSAGSMKRHPQGQSPYPIYRVNQEQLANDVFFEHSPKARPGERTVHYEKASKVLNEHELADLGLDSQYFGPNSNARVDEQEEETIETSVLKGGSRELEDLYNSMKLEGSDYFDRQRARSVSPDRHGLESEQSQKRTVIFGSVDEVNNQEQEFYPYRDAHQGKVSN